MVLTREEKSQRISNGMKRAKQDDPEGYALSNKQRSESHIKRIMELKENNPEKWRLEKRKRDDGTAFMHADPKRRKRWINNVTCGNGSLKVGNKVNVINIPTTKGALPCYVRGYENRTIHLLTAAFSNQLLTTFQFKNDCYFDKVSVQHNEDFLQSLQIDSIKYSTGETSNTEELNDKHYTYDHQLLIPYKYREHFMSKLGSLFKTSIRRYIPEYDKVTVLIETKSFSGSKRYRGVNWWKEIVDKSSCVDSNKRAVYLLFEQNQYGVVLFVRDVKEKKLKPIGISVYSKQNAKENLLKYFDQFKPHVSLERFKSWE